MSEVKSPIVQMAPKPSCLVTCGNQSFGCHGELLTLRSKTFAAQLLEMPRSIVIPDTYHDILELALKCIYADNPMPLIRSDAIAPLVDFCEWAELGCLLVFILSAIKRTAPHLVSIPTLIQIANLAHRCSLPTNLDDAVGLIYTRSKSDSYVVHCDTFDTMLPGATTALIRKMFNEQK